MWWPFRKKQDELLALVTKVIEQNNETQKGFLDAANRIAEVAKQQGEVLGKYLDLFKSPEPPRRWTSKDQEQAELQQLLEEEGFPVDGTEKERTEWLMNNL